MLSIEKDSLDSVSVPLFASSSAERKQFVGLEHEMSTQGFNKLIALGLVMVLMLFACVTTALDTRTKYVMNLDYLTWHKVMRKSRDVLVKFDVEYPHGEWQDAFVEFAELVGNASRYRSTAALLAEVRTLENEASPNLPLLKSLGISGKDEDMPLIWFFLHDRSEDGEVVRPKSHEVKTPAGGRYALGHPRIVSYSTKVFGNPTASALARWWTNMTGQWIPGLVGVSDELSLAVRSELERGDEHANAIVGRWSSFDALIEQHKSAGQAMKRWETVKFVDFYATVVTMLREESEATPQELLRSLKSDIATKCIGEHRPTDTATGRPLSAAEKRHAGGGGGCPVEEWKLNILQSILHPGSISWKQL